MISTSPPRRLLTSRLWSVHTENRRSSVSLYSLGGMMADYCEGGQFDGNALVTARDRQLCTDGGGGVVSRGGPSGACSGDTVQNVSGARGDPIDPGPLYAARNRYPQAREIDLLTRLSQAAAPVVERMLLEEPQLTETAVSGFARLVALSERLGDERSDEVLYTDDDHEYFVSLAQAVAEFGGDEGLRVLTQEAISLAEPYRGLPASVVRDRLGPGPDLSDLPVGEVSIEVPVPPQSVREGIFTAELPLSPYPTGLTEPISSRWDAKSVIQIFNALREAEEAIAEKAAALGPLASTPQGDVRYVADGYYRRFADCDIYYSPETGAHEVHGAIREKYLLVNGPVRLGLPITDETGTPDGRGRFNHFAKQASIYWHPGTGPFWLSGAVRFRWASLGWETGSLGYPVQDEESLGGLHPGDDPDMHWTHFQNGMVFGQGPEAREALAATASADRIKDAIGAVLERRMPARDYKVGPFSIKVTVRPGLHGVDVVRVDDWTYGSYGSGLRTLLLRVRGFVSLPIVSDPEFEIDLALQFSAVWQPLFTFPPTKTVVATLVGSSIRVNGIFSDEIANQIKQALQDAFTPPLGNPEVPGSSMVLATAPTGANQQGKGNLDFLDVMLMADGSLNVYVVPLPPMAGIGRANEAQRRLDSALANIGR
jgi:LGFP repeat